MSDESKLQTLHGIQDKALNYFHAYLDYVCGVQEDPAFLAQYMQVLGMLRYQASKEGVTLPEMGDPGSEALDFLVLAGRILEAPAPQDPNGYTVATEAGVVIAQVEHHELTPTPASTRDGEPLAVQVCRAWEEGRISYRRGTALLKEMLKQTMNT